jgi:hypothetical protein
LLREQDRYCGVSPEGVSVKKFRTFRLDRRYARALYLIGIVAMLVVASGADRKFD